MSKAGLYTLRFSKLIAFGYNNVISSNPIEIEIVNKKEKHIDFKINSDKAVYHLNDSINIKGEIKNISDKVLVVDSTYGMNLEITDSKGGKIDAIKNEAEVLLAIQSKILRPNESLYLNSGLHHHFILDKLGRYFIKARYSTSYSILEEEKKSTCYWAGVLESNIINIQLVE